MTICRYRWIPNTRLVSAACIIDARQWYRNGQPRRPGSIAIACVKADEMLDNHANRQLLPHARQVLKTLV
ncbi:hypothetical protein AB7B99_28515 [Klebsiella pneumoniae]